MKTLSALTEFKFLGYVLAQSAKKSGNKIRSFLVLKICTNDFFSNMHFWNVGGVPNNPQSKNIIIILISRLLTFLNHRLKSHRDAERWK
jgi:hypothetical protein